jgi:hypothetical protein
LPEANNIVAARVADERNAPAGDENERGTMRLNM